MHLDIDLVWGGYYAHKEFETKDYSITRILDFNIVQYQAVLYNEHYETIPTLETIDKIDNIKPLAFCSYEYKSSSVAYSRVYSNWQKSFRGV